MRDLPVRFRGSRWLPWLAIALAAQLAIAGTGRYRLAPADAPAAESIEVAPGFAVDLVASAQAGEGSWVALTFGDERTAFLAAQGGGLYRATLSEDGSKVEQLTEVKVPFRGAQGLCVARGTLFVMAEGEVAQGGGLWRLSELGGDGQFARVERVLEFGGGGEHGPHGIRLGSDGFLYAIFGNHVAVPAWAGKLSPVAHWAEDFIQEREWDARGHAVGILAPGGFVLRIDPATFASQVWCAGMRNSYDLVQGPDGDWFTYDSDMEWDIGAPWYRAPRIVHLVSGGDSGWRSGSANSPHTYFDHQAPVCQTDPASPTGVEWGGGGNFPESWRDSILVGDWSYGRILAVDLTPDGAGYSGNWRVFAQGRPMPVTDMAWGTGGNLFVLTGGRGLQSGFYRIRVSDAALAAKFPVPPLADPTAARARKTRRAIEALQSQSATPGELNECMAALDSTDPLIRAAARVALENQPLESWRDRLAKLDSPGAARAAWLALVRAGSAEDRQDVISQVAKACGGAKDALSRAELARIATIALSRGVNADSLALLGGAMDAWYPSDDAELDELLLPILVEARVSGIQDRALASKQAGDPSAAMRILLALRSIKDGWTPQSRGAFAQALARARTLRGGLSLQGFVDAIEADALAAFLANTPEAAMTHPVVAVGQAPVVAPFVREGHPPHEWTVEELAGSLNFDARSRNIERGREVFKAASCIACHRFAGEGGSTGPDLTGAGRRFTRRDLLVTGLEPSLTISDQYADEIFTLRDGSIVIGRVVEEKPDSLVIRVNPLEDEREVVAKSELASRVRSDISPMPRGLLNGFSRDEIIDLLAYLESAPSAQGGQ